MRRDIHICVNCYKPFTVNFDADICDECFHLGTRYLHRWRAHQPHDIGQSHESADAGARLIAAAPDLLEACLAVLGSDMAMREEDEGIESDVLNLVRAAIAKARG